MKLHTHGMHRGVAMLLALAVLAGGLGLAPETSLAASGVPSSFYYYADGQRIPLAVSTQWVAVRFTDDDPARQAAALQEAGAPLDASAERRDLPSRGLSLLPISPGVSEQDLLEGVRAMRQSAQDVQGASPVFMADDTELVLTDEFSSTFRPGMGRGQIDRINSRHGVTVVSEVLDQPNTFVLRLPAGAEQDALEMSNLYQESGEALTAAPNFLMILPPDPALATAASSGPLGVTPDDVLFPLQWYLDTPGDAVITPDNDIDAPAAWDIKAGEPTTIIAIVDEGVELYHEDLIDRIVPGYDATNGGSNGGPCSPAPPAVPHCGTLDDAGGTIAASLAAASANNGKGIAGVCPGCSIMPVRIAVGNGVGGWITDPATIANGITWAYLNGAGVINLGWEIDPATIITTAINNARTRGRLGKGTVVVGAAGSDGHTAVSYPASLSSVIAVGALNLCAARKLALADPCNHGEDGWASDYGSALDLMAPGVDMVAADRMGIDGYTTDSYLLSVSGPAAATPLVSGVAGLVLSENPDLTAAQVQTLLTKNADDLPPAGKDAQTGYGRVNAARTVAAAEALRALSTVKLAGVTLGTFYVPGGSSAAVHFSGTSGGQLRAGSANGVTKELASKGSISYTGVVPTGYNEMMGLPKALLTTEYWLPRYNNLESYLSQDALIVNADSVYNNTVQVYCGGVEAETNTLGPDATWVLWGPLDSGPCRARSLNGKKFIVSLRSYWNQGGTPTGYTEMMALPKSLLTTDYYFPWYSNGNPGVLAEKLIVGNADLYPAVVEVSTGSSLLGTHIIQQGQVWVVEYPTDVSPLRVRSLNGRKIIASIRAVAGGATYNEWMGFPRTKVTSQYYFPAYTVEAGLLQQYFDFVNVDTVWQTIDIYRGGKLQSNITLGPGEAGLMAFENAPYTYRMHSRTGKKFLVTLQSKLYNSGVMTSYHEMMGLPYTQLSADYWFPYYYFSGTTQTEWLNVGRP